MDMWGGGKPFTFSLTANLVTEHTQIKSNSLIVNKDLVRQNIFSNCNIENEV